MDVGGSRVRSWTPWLNASLAILLSGLVAPGATAQGWASRYDVRHVPTNGETFTIDVMAPTAAGGLLVASKAGDDGLVPFSIVAELDRDGHVLRSFSTEGMAITALDELPDGSVALAGLPVEDGDRIHL